MTIDERKMIVRSVTLSPYEVKTLHDAKGTLNLLFGRLTAKDNITHVAHILNELESLISELDDNANGILEFVNMEDM